MMCSTTAANKMIVLKTMSTIIMMRSVRLFIVDAAKIACRR